MPASKAINGLNNSQLVAIPTKTPHKLEPDLLTKHFKHSARLIGKSLVLTLSVLSLPTLSRAQAEADSGAPFSIVKSYTYDVNGGDFPAPDLKQLALADAQAKCDESADGSVATLVSETLSHQSSHTKEKFTYTGSYLCEGVNP
jgi:hypothetical protein